MLTKNEIEFTDYRKYEADDQACPSEIPANPRPDKRASRHATVTYAAWSIAVQSTWLSVDGGSTINAGG